MPAGLEEGCGVTADWLLLNCGFSENWFLSLFHLLDLNKACTLSGLLVEPVMASVCPPGPIII